MSTERIGNSLLALMLRGGVFPPALKVQQVKLPLGLLAADSCVPEAWVYFPVDALIAIGPMRTVSVAEAWVGRHGCLLWPSVGDGAMQAHVMAPGWAYRADWTAVRNDPTQYAQWLWHASVATQTLINQMAQWSFCVQHHTPSQRLASWLLHGMAQSPAFSLQLSLQAMPPAMRQCLDVLPPGVAPAPCGSGFDVREGIWAVPAPQQLSALACACHQKLAAR